MTDGGRPDVDRTRTRSSKQGAIKTTRFGFAALAQRKARQKNMLSAEVIGAGSRRPAKALINRVAGLKGWTVMVSIVAVLFAHNVVVRAESARGNKTSSASHGATGGAGDRAIDVLAVKEDNCRRYDMKDPPIYRTDFQWGLETEQFRKTGHDIYFGHNRLGHRFYISEKSVIKAPVGPLPGKVEVVVPRELVTHVKHHLRTAFQIHIIDHLALSDPGHAHFYGDNNNKRLVYSNIKKRKQSINQLIKGRYYLLYHFAERLRLKNGRDLSPDPYAQMRFLTRNFVGFPDGRIEIVHNINKDFNINSVYRLKKMENTGSILYISANYRGCFSVNRRDDMIRFDLSFISPSGAPEYIYDE